MKDTRSRLFKLALLATTIAAAPALAQDREPGAFAQENYTTPLADVCPDPLIIQKDWLAQAEHGGLYQMIGGGGEMSSGRYEGPLGSTGIDLVILDGGGGIGLGDGETAYSALYTGNSRAGVLPHIGYQELDNSFIFSERFPVVGVMAPLDVAPQGLWWDQATYPDGFHSIEDLIEFAESDQGMIYVSTVQRTFGLFLVQSGVPREVFLEGYRGDGEVFVTNNGTWLNQGFVTSEPYSFSTGNNWARPIDAVTVGELGYPNYTGMLSVATQRMEELEPCLEKVVPIIQQAWVDYMNDPDEVHELLVAYNEAGHATSWWTTPLDKLQYATETMRELGIAGKPGSGTMGEFDMERVARMHATVDAGQRKIRRRAAEIADGGVHQRHTAIVPLYEDAAAGRVATRVHLARKAHAVLGLDRADERRRAARRAAPDRPAEEVVLGVGGRHRQPAHVARVARIGVIGAGRVVIVDVEDRPALPRRPLAQARPRILLGAVDHAGPDRRGLDVAHAGEQVALRLHRRRAKAPFPDPAATRRKTIQQLRMTAGQVLHQLAEVAGLVDRVDDQPHVVRHQAVREDAQAEITLPLRQVLEIRPAVIGAGEYRESIDSPVQHVVGIVGEDNSGRPWHGTSLQKRGCESPKFDYFREV
jgi:hypothetical protein